MRSASGPQKLAARVAQASPRRWPVVPLVLSLVLALSQLAGIAPARAQADPCPESNNGFNDACFVGPGTPTVQGVISQAGDVDAYKFDVPTRLAQVRIELRDLPADYDVHLFDNSAGLIVEAVNQGTGPEVLDVTLIGGTYFVFVNAGGGQFDPSRPYTLDLRVVPNESSPGLAGDSCPEPNDDVARGCQIESGRIAYGALAGGNDVDVLRFEVAEAGSLVNARFGEGPDDVAFELVGGDGVVFDRGEIGSMIFSRLPAGTYFVRIRREGGTPEVAPYAILIAVTPPAVASSPGRDDACPEPNDRYETACTIGTGGPANGYISSPSDIDFYGFDVTGARSWVHIELTDLPKAYDIAVQDAFNKSIAFSGNSDTFPDVLDLNLDPGRYYITIGSPSAQSDNDRPYTLRLSMEHLGTGREPAATILFADNFNVQGAYFSATAADDTHQVGYYDGEYLVKLHQSGSPSSIKDQGQLAGVDLRDFRLDVDVRMSELASTCGGFTVLFRWQEQSSGYELYVDTVNRGQRGTASLSRFTRGDNDDLTDWIESDAIRTGSQSNHVTIQAAGTSLTVAINGQPILGVSDERFTHGDIALGAFTCDRPTEARFDNLIVTPVQ